MRSPRRDPARPQNALPVVRCVVFSVAVMCCVMLLSVWPLLLSHPGLGPAMAEFAYLNLNNPKVIIGKPMRPRRVTAWCGFWYGSIIGPFFFENELEAAVTVNGERYRAMLNVCTKKLGRSNGVL